MPRSPVNGVELEWESFGEGPLILLVMGIGAQLVHWPIAFCESLASHGFRVVRFDNRDIGKSSWLDDAGTVPIPKLWVKSSLRRPLDVPYTLSDMAADTAGLASYLGADRFHVVGASMGGMIAQTTALEHAGRVRSLTSIMSNTGAPFSGYGKPSATIALLKPSPPDREGAIARVVNLMGVIWGRGFPFEAERVRVVAGEAFDRGLHPAGFLRQLSAIRASGDRTAALRKLTVPTLVIHGDDDPLILPWAGMATARAVPEATMMWVRGMGHSLPTPAWPQMISAIAAHARAAEG